MAAQRLLYISIYDIIIMPDSFRSSSLPIRIQLRIKMFIYILSVSVWLSILYFILFHSILFYVWLNKQYSIANLFPTDSSATQEAEFIDFIYIELNWNQIMFLNKIIYSFVCFTSACRVWCGVMMRNTAISILIESTSYHQHHHHILHTPC